MKSYVLIPYSPEFAEHCEDAFEILKRQAHSAAGRIDHYRTDTVVKVYDCDEWLHPHDIRVTPDRVYLKGMVFWFRGVIAHA